MSTRCDIDITKRLTLRVDVNGNPMNEGGVVELSGVPTGTAGEDFHVIYCEELSLSEAEHLYAKLGEAIHEAREGGTG